VPRQRAAPTRAALFGEQSERAGAPQWPAATRSEADRPRGSPVVRAQHPPRPARSLRRSEARGRARAARGRIAAASQAPSVHARAPPRALSPPREHLRARSGLRASTSARALASARGHRRAGPRARWRRRTPHVSAACRSTRRSGGRRAASELPAAISTGWGERVPASGLLFELSSDGGGCRRATTRTWRAHGRYQAIPR
jgi:hypothetical protein